MAKRQSDITRNGWPLAHKYRITLRQSGLRVYERYLLPLAAPADPDPARPAPARAGG